MLDRVRVASRRHQPSVKFGVGIGEVRDEGAIEPNQAIAVVKIGKRKPVREGEISHRGQGSMRRAAAAFRRSLIYEYANLYRESDDNPPPSCWVFEDAPIGQKIGLEGP
jgi:hypothetical protein